MTRPSKLLTIIALTLAGTALADENGPAPPLLTPQEVESAVLEGFPSMEAAAAAVEAAEARLSRARRLPDPTLELGGGRGEDRYGPESGSQWRVGVELELPAPWRYGKATAAAEAGISVAAAELVGVRARTTARIRALLLRLAAAQRRALLLGSQVETVRSVAGLAALRVRLGGARELESLRMQVELGRIERVAALARAERDAASATLVRLSGGRLPAGFRLDLPLKHLPPELVLAALAFVFHGSSTAGGGRGLVRLPVSFHLTSIAGRPRQTVASRRRCLGPDQHCGAKHNLTRTCPAGQQSAKAAARQPPRPNASAGNRARPEYDPYRT